jgi:hypothetical protein
MSVKFFTPNLNSRQENVNDKMEFHQLVLLVIYL